MKRIDTINARENMFGIGKSGFHDNADLPGQDATYVSPEWFNTVQEELCNLLELRGITLNPASKHQLYDLLTTQADLEALADEIEANFIRKNQIADNLTTSDATKVASARTVKELQDNKLEKTDLKDASTTVKGVSRFATAAEVVDKSNVSAAVTPSNTATIAQSTDLGVGQTWQKPSRSLGATYTNDTGKPIQVFICANLDVGSFNVSGVVMDINDGSTYCFVNCVIPDGATYSLRSIYGGASIVSWAELR